MKFDRKSEPGCVSVQIGDVAFSVAYPAAMPANIKKTIRKDVPILFTYAFGFAWGQWSAIKSMVEKKSDTPVNDLQDRSST